MGGTSKMMKALTLAVVVALCATTIAVAATSVTPQVVLKKKVITYGEASPFGVKAVGGSFDGTVTVFKSIESSAGGFGAIFSTRTVEPKPLLNVNPGKLNQNTWFYASYVPSGTLDATASAPVMIGVQAKMWPLSYRAPKRVGTDKLGVSGSLEVTPAVLQTVKVDLQKLVKKSHVKMIGKKPFKFWKWEWAPLASNQATLTKTAKKGSECYYTFKTDFGTKASFKGLTVRAIVSYEDAVHVKAVRYGHWLTIRK